MHCSVGGTRLGDFQRRWVSGEFRGGSRGSLELPSEPKLFHFHREFKEICLKLGKRTPPFLHLNPLFRNPGSAPVGAGEEATYLLSRSISDL